MPFKDPEKRKEYELKRREKRKILRQTDQEYREKVLESERQSKWKNGHNRPMNEWLITREKQKRETEFRKKLKGTKGTKEYEKERERIKKYCDANREKIRQQVMAGYYRRRPDRSIISALQRVESGDMSFNEFDKLVGEAIARTNKISNRG